MAYSYVNHFYDVLVLGAGGAGLRAAVSASEHGRSVACISKVPVLRSHTIAAQGGINAALGNRAEDDWRWHLYDTVRGSDWLADQDAVALLCEHAPGAIVELEALGMPFTRDENGKIYQRAYGAQHTDFGKGGPAYRACAVADRTGHAMMHALYGAAVRQKVAFFTEFVALDFVFDDQNLCCGVLTWQLDTGELHLFHAHSIIVATGGFGQAYAATTSSTICTGDGNAMCLRAGLPLQDMEFVQFHPTGLYGTGILITEGARGEGAILLNGKGERFMERYAPRDKELASRDVISRAMMQEIFANRGCGPQKAYLHLDLSRLDNDVTKNKLPTIADLARTFARIDVTKSPVPVAPAVHYTMGGIPTNAQCQVISDEKVVPNLYAVGEAACASVHGANRLGCNSLLELAVFGKIGGHQAASNVKEGKAYKPISASLLEPALTRFDLLRQSKGTQKPSYLKKQMQGRMQRYASIFRTDALLKEGQRQLRDLWQLMQHDLHVSDKSLIWNNDLLDAIELNNLMRQASVTLASAAARTESRGAHFREDFPNRDDNKWLSHSLAFIDDNGTTRLSSRPVRLTYEEPKTKEEKSFPPEERVY